MAKTTTAKTAIPATSKTGANPTTDIMVRFNQSIKKSQYSKADAYRRKYGLMTIQDVLRVALAKLLSDV